MDEMELWEADYLLKNAHAPHRQSWEQTRLIMWAALNANPYSKPIKTDFFPLEWDNEDKNDKPKETGEIIEITDIKRIEEEYRKTRELERKLREKRKKKRGKK